jgi:catechol 2,3-dioxygenase-like lactoylglutathione lyase family enzyme
VSVELNHTIVASHDHVAAARHVAELLGLEAPTRFGPFMVVETDNGVSLDYRNVTGDIHHQHYAFLVSDDDFDAIFGRVQARGAPYWADPGRRREGEINRNDGGRGVYFEDLDGHLLEIITVPYGGG